SSWLLPLFPRRSFGFVFEGVERLAPEPIEVFAQCVQPCGVELVDPVAALAPLPHDACVFQNPEVLRDGRTADVEVLGELVHAVRPAGQILQNRATRRVGDGSKRVGRIGNHTVTYYYDFTRVLVKPEHGCAGGGGIYTAETTRPDAEDRLPVM